MNQPSAFAQAAPVYIDNGFSVIPIMPGSKAPGQYYNNVWSPMPGWTMYEERLPTQEEIDLWTTWPNAGIGLVLGRASGVIAVDFDDDVGGSHAKIQAIMTPSPIRKKGEKGFTSFYKYSGEKTRKWSKDGKSVIEILSSGRQTLMPPSKHPNGNNYVWLSIDNLDYFSKADLPALDENIVEAINGILEVKKKITSENFVKKYHASSEEEDIARALTYITADDYETWIQIGMGLKTEIGNNGYGLWDSWSRKSKKYNPEEMLNKWDSFNSAGINIGTIFYHAINNGYVPRPIGTEITDIKFMLDEPAPKPVEITAVKSDDIFSPPGLTGDIFNWILETAIQPQPLLALAAAISATGAIMGHKVKSETNLRSNMLTLGLGPSAAGKDHPRKCIISLFKAAGIERLQGGTPVSGAGLLSSLFLGHGKRLLQIDEMGRVLKSLTGKNAMAHQSDILTNIMMLFSSANSIFYGSEYANHDGKFDRKDINQPCLCIFGTTVPGRFYQALTSEEAIDGFLSRWLIFESNDASPRRQAGGPIDEPPQHLIDKVRHWESRPTNFYPKTAGNMESTFINPQTIPFTKEAAELMDKYYQHADEARVKAYTEGRGLDAIWGRAYEHAVKLALIAHEGQAISLAAAAWATNVAEFCVTHSIDAINKRLADNQQEADTRKLLAIVRAKRTWISRSELTKRTYWLNPAQRSGILTALIEAGELEQGEEKSSDTTKKASTYYRSM